MKLSRAAGAVSFIGALTIGILVAGLFAALSFTDKEAVQIDQRDAEVQVTYRLSPVPRMKAADVEAEDLVGVWRGTWDHGQVPATLTIKRVDGNKFSGILRQAEAEIAFSGTFDESDRRVFFHETKVLRIGAYSEWSLGTNSGGFSADGRTLCGTGVDKWGTYPFELVKK